MIKVDREEAEGQLGRLIEAAAGGQDVVITTAGGSAVRLVPVSGEQTAEMRDRRAFSEESVPGHVAEAEPSASDAMEGETERRRRFFAALNAAYEELRTHEDDWKDLEAERRVWDSTLLDGLPAGEAWDEDGDLTSPPSRVTGGR
jgi:antitoxin (DNA-binding transcriptional repressor) of toxin-antitoxin stability system